MGTRRKNILDDLRRRNELNSRSSSPLVGREPRAVLCQPSPAPPTLPGLSESQMEAHLGCTENGAVKRAGEINSTGKTSSADAAELRTPVRVCV